MLDVSNVRPKLPAMVAPTPEELEGLWQALTEPDSVRAHGAAVALAKFPKVAIAFLKERVHPAAPVADRERIRKLLLELDDDGFDVRQRAQEALSTGGEEAAGLLRLVLDESRTSAEVRRRGERILEAIAARATPPSSATLCDLRVIDLLEHLGTTEARALLKLLSEGAPEVWVTREARASLKRLGE